MDSRSVARGVVGRPKTLSIMPTYTCTARCTDCGTLSSPHDRAKISRDVILSSIQQAKDLNFANVVFTGGEATLRWNDLLAGIEYAKSIGLPTRLVTNAHWATTAVTAEQRMDALANAGLDEINFSTGDEHVVYVPLEKIINAIKAAVKVGFDVHVMIEMRKANRVSKESIMQHAEILDLPAEAKKRVNVNESPWMPLNPDVKAAYPEGVVANSKNIGCRSGCESVLQTYVLQADGRIGACCGLGMRIVPELSVGLSKGPDFLAKSIRAAENDLMKLWLRYKGPEKILEWISERDGSVKWENMYGHHCQACMRIYTDRNVQKAIRENWAEVLADLIQCAWLEERYIPATLCQAELEEVS